MIDRSLPVRPAALVLVVTLLTLGALLFGARPAAADVDDFTFDSFRADMTLSRAADGHAELAVTETIVARFPDADQNRGIVRVLPDDYDGVPLQTAVQSVTDADGRPVPFETDADRDTVRVLTGDDTYVRGIQTYVISYTQRDAIRSFADTDADEFYRDINGVDWAQPFGEVSVRLTVDAALTGALLDGAASCYVGEQNDGTACPIAREDDDLFVAGARDLGPNENVSIAVGFARGTFVPGEVVRTPVEAASLAAAPALQGGSIAAIGAGVAAIVTALVVRRRTRDAAGRGVIVAEYDPPREVDVVQAAQLVGRGSTGVPAAILDAAIAGRLRIVESAASAGLTLELGDARPTSPLHDAVVSAIFGEHARLGARVTLGPDRQDVAKALQSLPASAIEELRRRELTEKRRAGGAVAAALIAIGAFVLSVIAVVFSAIGGGPLWFQFVAIPVTVACGIAAFSLLRYRDRITDAGAPVRDHLEGLREYLRLAEADRLRVLQSPEGAERRRIDADDPVQVLHLYERLLPWAVVWGVEKEWVEALDVRVRETGITPIWYVGGNGFSSGAFLGTLGSVRSASTPTPVTTSGSGSFSGGSFGGGFSGGGSGGGGGGGR